MHLIIQCVPYIWSTTKGICRRVWSQIFVIPLNTKDSKFVNKLLKHVWTMSSTSLWVRDEQSGATLRTDPFWHWQCKWWTRVSALALVVCAIENFQTARHRESFASLRTTPQIALEIAMQLHSVIKIDSQFLYLLHTFLSSKTRIF